MNYTYLHACCSFSMYLLFKLCEIYLDVTQELLRPGGELELVGESECFVDGLHEVQCPGHFLLDLVRTAEDVGVVLLEPPHPGQPCQGSGKLVPVENSKVGHPEGQVLVGTDAVVEDEAMS